MVLLTTAQIDKTMKNWFKAIDIKEYKCIQNGKLHIDKSLCKQLGMGVFSKTAESYRIYIFEHRNVPQAIIIIESHVNVDKNHILPCKYIEAILRPYMCVENFRDIYKDIPTKDAINWLIKNNNGTLEDVDYFEKEVYPRYHILTSYTLTDQLLNFTLENLDFKFKIFDLPTIYPMLGGDELYGLTADYEVVPYKVPYNDKEYSIIFEDDVMCRILMARPGELIRCSRVLFEGSAYIETITKVVTIRCNDD